MQFSRVAVSVVAAAMLVIDSRPGRSTRS
jgi:hypothetical protein